MKRSLSFLALSLLAILLTGGYFFFAANGPVPAKAQAVEQKNDPLAPEVRFDTLVIEKQKRLLTAYVQGKPVRVYRVALGGSPVGPKRVQGDEKTPEGTYRVDGKNPHSRYYKNLGVSYPNAEDRKRAASLGKSPGGDIKIHGLGPEFRHLGKEQWQYDWTLGCIAVTDAEIDELYAHTNVGAVIEILP
ncbi:MAG: hypothetical protein DELT_02733 [Desulfovibrio sp.]